MAERITVYFPTTSAARKALISLRPSFPCSEPMYSNRPQQGLPIKLIITLPDTKGSAYATALDRVITIANQCGGRIIEEQI